MWLLCSCGCLVCVLTRHRRGHARTLKLKQTPFAWRESSPSSNSPFTFSDFLGGVLLSLFRCIFAEMATGRPLLTGTSESDQLARIFRQMGTPTPLMYPGLQELPDYRVSAATRSSSSLYMPILLFLSRCSFSQGRVTFLSFWPPEAQSYDSLLACCAGVTQLLVVVLSSFFSPPPLPPSNFSSPVPLALSLLDVTLAICRFPVL